MKLIIINGPCGAGKSSLAKKMHEKMPLSVLIEVDELRRLISDYRENRKKSGFLSFELALGLMEKSFESGCDVVIERVMFQYLEAPKDYLNEFFDLARKYDVHVYEIILTASENTIIDRIEKRGLDDRSLLTIERAKEFYEKMEMYIPQRKEAQIINTENLTKQEVFISAWNAINDYKKKNEKN